jgi:hypothetical protein
MTDPIRDLLYAAHATEPIHTTLQWHDPNVVIDAADQGLVEVRHAAHHEKISMRWAVREASTDAQRNLLAIHITDAGNELLRSLT